MQNDQSNQNANQDGGGQPSQSGAGAPQQGSTHGKLTPSGGSNQQTQQGGGQNQHGSNIKHEGGLAHSHDGQSPQGSDPGKAG